MNFTQEQISQILVELANKGGPHLLLKVPRTRGGMFYPSLLAVIGDEDEERVN